MICEGYINYTFTIGKGELIHKGRYPFRDIKSLFEGYRYIHHNHENYLHREFKSIFYSQDTNDYLTSLK